MANQPFTGPTTDADFQPATMHGLAEGPTAPLQKGHPKGLYLLFTVEMWERFSFYGMKAILFLYMTNAVLNGGLGWSEEHAGWIMGLYAGLVYLTPVIGGYLADRYLGTRRSMVIGGYIIAAGHFMLALESIPTFFGGLASIIIGTGFFKSNVSTMVGQLYQQGDRRRDAAFTIFYMGINLGAFLAPLVCGALQTSYGFRYGFAAAGVGMVLGQLCFLMFRPKIMPGIGDPPGNSAVEAAQYCDRCGYPLRGLPVERACPECGGRQRVDSPRNLPLSPEEKNRIIAILIMAVMVIFFWTAFEQASTSLTVFARDRTDMTAPESLQWVVPAPEAVSTGAKTVPTFPVAWFQSVNPLLILILAPFFAFLWVRLAARGREPSTPVKMGLGMLIASAGFVVMVFAALKSQDGPPDANGVATIVRVSPMWLLVAYLLHTLGELCLSPVGLSMVTKLAPWKFASLLMGCWFLANFIANFAAGVLGGLVNRIGEKGFILPGQAGFFLLFVIGPAAAGIITLMLAPMLKKLMHGRA